MGIQSMTGGFEHVTLGPGECRYGSLVASPLTKEQLLKALTCIQLEDANLDMLFQMAGYETATDDMAQEIAARSAAELYSDKLLEYLNKNLKPLYAAFCTHVFDSDVELMREEGYVGHGIKFLDVVHDKPAVCVGTRFCGGGGVLGFTNYCQECTYIDSDGNVLSVLEYDLAVGSEDEIVIGSRTRLEERGGLFLDLVQEYFPDEYDGFWDV